MIRWASRGGEAAPCRNGCDPWWKGNRESARGVLSLVEWRPVSAVSGEGKGGVLADGGGR